MRPSLVTLAAAAVVAYAVSNVVHEALGHGVACEVLGGRLVAVNAVYVECEPAAMGDLALRLKAAAGSVANLVLAGIAYVGLRVRTGRARGPLDLVLWLLLTVSLLQPTGYLLFSGVAGVGDWVNVAGDGAVARALLTVVGAGAYWAAIRVSLSWLTRFLAAEPDRQRLAVRLTVFPWLVGGSLYALAGAFNPIGLEIMLVSALAAGFGGTSALAWMAQLLKDPSRWREPADPLSLPEPSLALWVTAVVVGLGFVAVLGPTVSLGTP